MKAEPSHRIQNEVDEQSWNQSELSLSPRDRKDNDPRGPRPPVSHLITPTFTSLKKFLRVKAAESLRGSGARGQREDTSAALCVCVNRYDIEQREKERRQHNATKADPSVSSLLFTEQCRSAEGRLSGLDSERIHVFSHGEK